MTPCAKNLLRFDSLGTKQIIGNFDGGRITSDTGVLLLREIDKRTGLIDALSNAIPDPRDPSKIEHDQKTMLAQRIFGIACQWRANLKEILWQAVLAADSGRGIVLPRDSKKRVNRQARGTD